LFIGFLALSRVLIGGGMVVYSPPPIKMGETA